MARMSISEATDLLGRLVAHWRQRMGDAFAVGSQELTDLVALRDQLATAIQEYDAALQVANEKKATRDALLKNAETTRANYRRQVAINKGTGSSEYKTIPESAKGTRKPTESPSTP
ncbi:MAG: hypothetical protein COZ06_37790 [Armatimonadetes bacterium CG_4_10_14_3_um_filter_66_18]|nr:hypothetical protein [Armatimonadota bacterium]OIP09746.1 MAG: hypothetical protein AUJ96_04750 [Armatimonadetes bacterium CG2_30_66_41]PIU94300.1 MAG: hypothetical protein COS65_08335 [Armatimonadetes bacterium CG06_land_8_20_14_3_00_66_21]PIX40167.1 MAG: hypothetical protein COZ57_26650 [Armatimonadetes bacterium CG_4_8_14_3_um_filter_66_20]PIY35656.1 MAG: hypothetical protein COZ06_37790 [Armatimonadetes bacterium CG_4_10_14_3_um_filter_66_18]PJB63421.1 MAG: hypothetical protein CO096_22